MERFAAKVRQLVTSEDGPTSTEYAVVLVLLSILGFVVYRLLQDGLF
jgi:Flp pilus assembly pilin Flp